MLKVTEIRALKTDELKKKLDDSYRELFNLRFRLATKQLSNYHEVRNVKKKIAKIKTVMRERESK
jgi:large subunit ribosomal protein L29